MNRFTLSEMERDVEARMKEMNMDVQQFWDWYFSVDSSSDIEEVVSVSESYPTSDESLKKRWRTFVEPGSITF